MNKDESSTKSPKLFTRLQLQTQSKTSENEEKNRKANGPITISDSDDNDDGNLPDVKSSDGMAAAASPKPTASHAVLGSGVMAKETASIAEGKKADASSVHKQKDATSEKPKYNLPILPTSSGKYSAGSEERRDKGGIATDTANTPKAPEMAAQTTHRPVIPLWPMPTAGLRNHDDRVGHLLKAGWPYSDVINALEASKDQEGEEDVGRAQTHLEHLHVWRLGRFNRPTASEMQASDEPEKIKEGSECALYIACHCDDIDALLVVLDVHEKSQTSHNADLFRTAANLMTHSRVMAATRQLSAERVKKMAISVVNDCERCSAHRIKHREEKAEAKKRDDEAACKRKREEELKTERDASRARREVEETQKREAAAARRPKTPPLPELSDNDSEGSSPNSTNDFDPKDSKWSYKKRRSICAYCNKGDLGDKEKDTWLNVCETCGRNYHKGCTKWHKIQQPETKQIKWACLTCHCDRVC